MLLQVVKFETTDFVDILLLLFIKTLFGNLSLNKDRHLNGPYFYVYLSNNLNPKLKLFHPEKFDFANLHFSADNLTSFIISVGTYSVNMYENGYNYHIIIVLGDFILQ